MKRLACYNVLRTFGLGPVRAWRLSIPITLIDRLFVPTGIAVTLALWTAFVVVWVAP